MEVLNVSFSVKDLCVCKILKVIDGRFSTCAHSCIHVNVSHDGGSIYWSGGWTNEKSLLRVLTNEKGVFLVR